MLNYPKAQIEIYCMLEQKSSKCVGYKMTLKQIESEALHLSEDERAELAQKLLLSLDSPSESEIADDWLLEASRRAKDIDNGTVQAIPAEEVRLKAQALLR